MEENLEQVKKFNNEISDNTKEINLEEQKEPKSGTIKLNLKLILLIKLT